MAAVAAVECGTDLPATAAYWGGADGVTVAMAVATFPPSVTKKNTLNQISNQAVAVKM